MELFVAAAALVVFVGFFLLRASLVFAKKPSFERYWRRQLEAEIAPDAVRLVVFGDSISRGIGAGWPRYSLVGRAAAYIAEQTGRPVHVANYSRSGATADEVVKVQLPKADLISADIIMLEIGANDTRKRTAREFRANITKIITALPLEKTVIADLPGLGNRGVYQAALDDALAGKTVARADFGRVFRDVRTSVGITAGDFFHPNARGYKLWFKAFQPGIKDVLTRQNLLKTEAK